MVIQNTSIHLVLWRSWQRVRHTIKRLWVRIPTVSNNDRLVSITGFDGWFKVEVILSTSTHGYRKDTEPL